MRWDADTSVGNDEFESRATGIGSNGAKGDGDQAAFGEFQGIANQIDENLAKAGGIPVDERRGVFGDLPADVDGFFVGDRSEELQSVFQALFGRKFETFEFELAGFHFGEVQNVVEEMKQ